MAPGGVPGAVDGAAADGGGASGAGAVGVGDGVGAGAVGAAGDVVAGEFGTGAGEGAGAAGVGAGVAGAGVAGVDVAGVVDGAGGAVVVCARASSAAPAVSATQAATIALYFIEPLRIVPMASDHMALYMVRGAKITRR